MGEAGLRKRARALKRETVALYFAARDPRTPWAARVVVGLVVAYALSPIDLIPDFVPVLGLLDDLVLVPLGIALALRMVPTEAMEAGRAIAAKQEERPVSMLGAALVALAWLSAVGVALLWWRSLHR